MNIIILAAGKSSRIFNKIKKNKCLIEFKKKNLLNRIIHIFQINNFNKITVVSGYKKHLIKKAIDSKNIKLINNKDYLKSDMVKSIMCALNLIHDDIIVSYSDIIFNKIVIKNLKNQIIKNKKKILIPSLKNWKNIWAIRNKKNYDFESFKLNKFNRIQKIGDKDANSKDVNGQFMGLIYIPKNKLKLLKTTYNSNNFKKIQLTEILNIFLKKKEKLYAINKNFSWYEFDDYEDYKNFKKIKHLFENI